MSRIAQILAVCAAAALCPSAAAGGGFPRFGAGCSRADFRSGGVNIRAEFCRATGGGRAAVIVLHGCGGFSTFDHRLATTLPGDGISTLDVDYFAATPPPGRKGFCNAHGAAATAFETWIRIADDAAAKLRSTAGVRRVGAVGWSLGGGVVVATAASPGLRRPFAAIAGFSTAAFGAEALASHLPPTILLSGGSTDAIPIQDTRPLYAALRAAHVPSELYVYPQGSHAWPGRQGALGISRAAAFLRRYLG